MKSPVTARHYIDPEVHVREQERLFRELWIFVGLKSAVAEPNGFITRRIGDVPVVVQNMDGELRAFENTCVHRQMAMQMEDCGKRPLVCKYHAWAYDNEGKLKSIGNEFLYELTEEEKERACLRRFALQTVGNLLFVNLAEKPLPIEEQFTADHIESMREASLHFDDVYAYTKFEQKFNWKLNFENVLDHNHIPFIHTKSFLPLITLNVNGPPEKRVLDEGTRAIKARLDANEPVRLDELSYLASSPLAIEPLWYQKEVERYGDQDRYYTWFGYPNLNIGSVHGTMFLLQQYMPISPGRLEYHLWVMTARRKKKTSNFTALLWGLMKAEKKVIDEDSSALEALQAALHKDGPSYMHGVYEAHIVRMLRWYAARIDGERPPVPALTSYETHEKTHRYR